MSDEKVGQDPEAVEEAREIAATILRYYQEDSRVEDSRVEEASGAINDPVKAMKEIERKLTDDIALLRLHPVSMQQGSKSHTELKVKAKVLETAVLDFVNNARATKLPGNGKQRGERPELLEKLNGLHEKIEELSPLYGNQMERLAGIAGEARALHSHVSIYQQEVVTTESCVCGSVLI